VHAAELITTGVSGAFHCRFGNVDIALFKRLVIPGVIGGVLGAYVLVNLPGDESRPFIALYLLVMGLVIIRKALVKTEHRVVTTHLATIGFAGGFLDAIGGGGWGPVVTSTLVARGNHPTVTIGSVNLAEFFVTFAQVATFVFTIGIHHWQIIAGLIVGGVIAAPIAAYGTRRLPTRLLMALVGALIVLVSIRTIYLALR